MVTAKNINRNSTLVENGDVRRYIFGASALMIGVCLVVIGIFRTPLEKRPLTRLDEHLLAIDAFLFMVSYVSSYYALKASKENRRYLMEQIAENVFMVALFILVVICILIVYRFV